MIIEALCVLGDYVKAAPLVKELSVQLSNSSFWMSTQTTAYSLIGISRFAKSGGASGSMNYSYAINGASPQSKNTQLPMSQMDLGIKGTEGGKVSVTNSGKGVMYARIILEGVPEEGDKTAAESNLGMTVSYFKKDGKPLDVSKLEQGTDFYAEVTVTNPGYRDKLYSEMSLIQIFPSGWEIHNTRMDESESAIKSSVPTYQDIRDDRVYTYFDVNVKQPVTFRIVLNAAYIGKFYLPSVQCEAMYDNSINSRKPGQWVEVVKAGAI
jgi:uncharacterized protein YfaS (alpha-2-macroglobulin family)